MPRVNKTDVKRGVITFLIEKACHKCGKLFFAPKKEVERGMRKYCSRSCALTSRTGKTKIIPCRKCGKEIKIPNCRENKGGGIFCSRECSVAGRNSSKKPTLYRLMALVNKNRPNGCWTFMGRKNGDGYGQLAPKGKRSQGAHRVSYMLFIGEIPPDKVVMHTCDNRECVSPFHLKLGTQVENILDMCSKGRHVPVRGSESARSRFTAEQRKFIKDNYQGEKGEKFRLSKQYKCSPTTITNILESPYD